MSRKPLAVTGGRIFANTPTGHGLAAQSFNGHCPCWTRRQPVVGICLERLPGCFLSASKTGRRDGKISRRCEMMPSPIALLANVRMVRYNQNARGNNGSDNLQVRRVRKVLLEGALPNLWPAAGRFDAAFGRCKWCRHRFPSFFPAPVYLFMYFHAVR